MVLQDRKLAEATGAREPRPSLDVSRVWLCSAIRAFTAEHDAVVVMTPAYAPLQDCISGCGRASGSKDVVGGDGCGRTEVSERIGDANMCAAALHKVLTSKRISQRTKLRVYNIRITK